ncbi:unnamed protein product [Caenorhabditis angaria]|uniref:TATA box-binding protein-like 1 n=1 Tax=Caenorhabditis angaria TaxID=860376 RepID=A0A9P1I4U1_9PELO|nr:unnamed protein product [Caenorhabditis angaria]
MSIDFTSNNRKPSIEQQQQPNSSEHRVYIQKTMNNQLLQQGLADGTVRMVPRSNIVSIPGVSNGQHHPQQQRVQQQHQQQHVQPIQNRGQIQYIAAGGAGMNGTIAGRNNIVNGNGVGIPMQRVVAQQQGGGQVFRTIVQTQPVRPQPNYVQSGIPPNNLQQHPQQQQIRQIRYVQPVSNIQQQQHHSQHPAVMQQYQPQPQQPQHQNRPIYTNLAVPLREPSPEYIPIRQDIKTEPEEAESTSANSEPLPPEDADIDIQIRNVVCNYTLPLHIDLRKLAMMTKNVTYEREKGVMMKQKRNPNCFIKIYSSGKVYIVGCRSEDDCRKAARSIARHVQRVMGKAAQRVCIRNYRVNNVLATCRMPFGIKIESIASKYPAEVSYEQELSVGLVWKSVTPKATLRIHTTGSITVTGARSEADVLEVISKIYPIVLEFRCQKRSKNNVDANKKKRRAPANPGRAPPVKRERIDYGSSGVINNKVYFSDEDEDLYDELDLEE